MSHSNFKHYKVLSKIGEGSFSEVLKVQDFKTGNNYAAKRLKKVYNNEEDVRTCPEVQAIKNLEYHPNVVGLVDIYCDPFPGHVTLVLELMDMSLYDYIKNRKRCLPESRVKNFLFQLVCGVHHLHNNGIFHRDIKPENVLIKILDRNRVNSKRTEVVQLADLGSVCDVHKNAPHTEYISTRWYRAPECLLTSGYYGPKMDIWSLGCVYYEMLTLLPLFPGDNELDQLHKIHEIIGTPTPTMLSRFKHRNINYYFPKTKPIGIYNLVPMLSEKGVNILNKTLCYVPDIRIDSNRLMQHAYFNDLRASRFSFSEFSSMPSLLTPTKKRSSYSFKSTVVDSKKNTSNKSFSDPNCGLQSSCTSKSLDTYLSFRRNLDSAHSVLKQRERAWGMNPGNAKTALINNIKASQKRSRRNS